MLAFAGQYYFRQPTFHPMKHFLLLALFSGLSAAGSYAQTSDIIVFSDAGEKFSLVIDGQARNEVPAARVEARGVRNATPMLLVNFADAAIPPLKQNGWMEPGQEYTLRITTNKKGERVLRLQGQTPLGASDAAAAKPAPADFKDDPPAANDPEEVIATDPNIVRSTTTVTTTDGTGVQNVNMNVGGNGVNVSWSVNGTGGNTTSTTTTTTTTTTTSATTDQATATDPAPTAPAKGSGCTRPMAPADFNEALKSIEGKGFDQTKLTLAKQVGGSNCLSTGQVKQVMGLFGFEDSKLEFAKFAYDHVTDPGNYFKVNDAFGFSSSVDELNSYIQGR